MYTYVCTQHYLAIKKFKLTVRILFKVIMSSLQNSYSEEGLSTAPWSFFLSVTPFLSLLLPYKKARNSRKRCRSSAKASDYVTRKQLLAHMNINMKHAPIYNRHDVCFFTSSASKQHDYTLEQIDFGCFSIVIFDNTAALPCKRYC